MNNNISFEEPERCPVIGCTGGIEAASVSSGGRVGWLCDECMTIYPDGSSDITAGEVLTDVVVE